MSDERTRGHDFRNAKIDKVVLGDDRSVSDVKADQVQAATGDYNQLQMDIQLPTPSASDMDVNLDAIRQILKAQQLEEEDAKAIERYLDNAQEELHEPEPNRETIDTALERTTKRLEKVGKLAGAVDSLKPYVIALAQGLGLASVWIPNYFR